MDNILDNEIGIVGIGFVGEALKEAYEEWGVSGIETYDKNKPCSCEDLEQITDKCKYIFICLPTPTVDNKPDFKIVRNACLEINLYCKEKEYKDKTILIKSTTLPSEIREINDLCTNVKIVANPEFLSQKTALEDTLNPTRVVYGCDDKEYAHKISSIFSFSFLKAKTQYIITGLEEAMKIKYVSNAFGAYKVLFFNIVHGWCNSHEEYDAVKRGACASGWIADMHTTVPHNNSFGFGGACLPKDLLAFISELQKAGFKNEADYLNKCMELNNKIKDKKETIEL